MSFHVGQKVVCIKRGPWSPDCGETFPVYGSCYTIRAIADFGYGPHFLLAEISNKPQRYEEGFHECCFAACRFRPIVTTDISIFTAMLNPSRLKELEPR